MTWKLAKAIKICLDLYWEERLHSESTGEEHPLDTFTDTTVQEFGYLDILTCSTKKKVCANYGWWWRWMWAWIFICLLWDFLVPLFNQCKTVLPDLSCLLTISSCDVLRIPKCIFWQQPLPHWSFHHCRRMLKLIFPAFQVECSITQHKWPPMGLGKYIQKP